MNLLDISRRMLDRNSNATRLVEKLRMKGLVDRKPSDKDRRQVEICITNEGLNLLKLLDRDSLIWGNKNRELAETEAEILNKLLEKMR
jgi:DNA-binding MarR family transcriptional regulator